MSLTTFSDLFRNRFSLASEWKAKSADRKVLGYFCCYVPEELIHAAGMLPFRILGTLEPITRADGYLETIACPFIRSCLDLGLKGAYSFLDGVVFPHTCDNVCKVEPVWTRYAQPQGAYSHYLDVPHLTDEEAHHFFETELQHFRRSLEGLSGAPISDEALWASIEVYNEHRRLLRNLFELRGRDAPLLSGEEMLMIQLAGLGMRKEEHNGLIRQLLEELPSREALPAKGVRLLVSGSEMDDGTLLRIVEELGGMIVADDLCTGSRYYWNEVDSHQSDDPLKALAHRYLAKIPCPRTYPSDDRFPHILQMIQDYRVQGVILNINKYCDTHLFEYPAFRSLLEQSGTPVLFLENDHTGGAIAQFRTRIEAFMEMIGESVYGDD